MKNIFIICLALFFTFCSNNNNENSLLQSEIIYDTIRIYDTIKKESASFPKNQNLCVTTSLIKQYLFVNIDNPMDISIAGKNNKLTDISCSNGTVKKSGRAFLIKPKEIGSTTIKVNYNGKLVVQRHFSAIRLPRPTPLLGNFRGNIINKTQLLKIKGLWAEMPSFFDFYGASILSFKIVVYNNGIEKESSSQNSRFTPEQIELIDQLQSGQKLYIENIMAKTQDGFEHELEIMKIIIK